MPTIMCTAAVEHQAWRGNGAMLVSGNSVLVAPQLENATMRNCYCTHETSRADGRISTATTNPSQLAAPHCLSRVRSLWRLRGASERPGRQQRLRAHTRERSRMPITRPVNGRGVQSTQNILIYGSDQIDTQRAIPRRKWRTLRRNVGILPQEYTTQRRSLGSITRFTSRRATRPGHELRVSFPFLGLPQLFFCSTKNWSLNRRHVETGSNLTGTGITGATFTRVRLGTAIASSYTRPLTASGIRVRRLAHRINVFPRGLNKPRRQRLVTWHAHVLIRNAIQRISPAVVADDCYAFWKTGGRVSTPGSPVTTPTAVAPEGLQCFTAGNFTGSCRTPYLAFHASWITGARASDTPGLPATLLASVTSGRSSLLSEGRTTGARHISAWERRSRSNSGAACPTFYPRRHSCWTTGGRESDTPGSSAESSSDTLRRVRHFLVYCFLSMTDADIAQQSTSSHSLALLRHFVLHPETTVRNFATWYDTRDWVQLWRTYSNAHSLAQDDHLRNAERVLLSSLSGEVPKGALFATLVAAVQHSRQALSDALTSAREDRQAHILRVQASFQQGLAAVAEATVLLPLMRLPAHSPSFEDIARQSVGIDGDGDT